ncbi:MAG: hypothetical protein M5U01_02030 [Ardenticatenaceae bacterium]|nr:hypothetical protein [Ardenticatenaceae bacterium]
MVLQRQGGFEPGRAGRQLQGQCKRGTPGEEPHLELINRGRHDRGRIGGDRLGAEVTHPRRQGLRRGHHRAGPLALGRGLAVGPRVPPAQAQRRLDQAGDLGLGVAQGHRQGLGKLGHGGAIRGGGAEVEGVEDRLARGMALGGIGQRDGRGHRPGRNLDPEPPVGGLQEAALRANGGRRAGVAHPNGGLRPGVHGGARLAHVDRQEHVAIDDAARETHLSAAVPGCADGQPAQLPAQGGVRSGDDLGITAIGDREGLWRQRTDQHEALIGLARGRIGERHRQGDRLARPDRFGGDREAELQPGDGRRGRERGGGGAVAASAGEAATAEVAAGGSASGAAGAPRPPAAARAPPAAHRSRPGAAPGSRASARPGAPGAGGRIEPGRRAATKASWYQAPSRGRRPRQGGNEESNVVQL